MNLRMIISIISKLFMIIRMISSKWMKINFSLIVWIHNNSKRQNKV